MTGRTHKRISLGCAYLGCLLIYLFKPFGLAFENLLGYYIVMAVCVEFCKEGTLFPDLDHSWQNLKEKTAVTKFINIIIHILGGKHRSRHTHSWDICLLASALGMFAIYHFLQESTYFMLYFTAGAGFFAGWITHLFADMLTADGVYPIFFAKKKIAFVPKKFFGIVFKTGDKWEDFVFKLATFLEWLFCISACLGPITLWMLKTFAIV